MQPAVGEKYQRYQTLLFLSLQFHQMFVYSVLAMCSVCSSSDRSNRNAQAIEIDDENVMVLVAAHLSQYTLHTDTQTHTPTYTLCHTPTLIRIKYCLFAFYATFFGPNHIICQCVRWIIGLCVCLSDSTCKLNAKVEFVCFGYCQLLFWFLSWCF